MRLFSAFLKNRRIAPRKGKQDTLFVWQFSIFGGVGNERKMKKFFKIPAYSGLCGFVRNVVLVYKCGQEKLNNLYYQVKKQRRC
ncbi:MAG: hypothetical protein K1W25_01145, partial [Lachnospiraceae bacterium]